MVKKSEKSEEKKEKKKKKKKNQKTILIFLAFPLCSNMKYLKCGTADFDLMIIMDMFVRHMRYQPFIQ